MAGSLGRLSGGRSVWAWPRRLVPVAAVGLAVLAGAPARAASQTFLGPLHRVVRLASTVPSNRDVNPYGIAIVPASMGRLVGGQVLVSNFNDRRNRQGTGTTIDEISRRGG